MIIVISAVHNIVIHTIIIIIGINICIRAIIVIYGTVVILIVPLLMFLWLFTSLILVLLLFLRLVLIILIDITITIVIVVISVITVILPSSPPPTHSLRDHGKWIQQSVNVIGEKNSIFIDPDTTIIMRRTHLMGKKFIAAATDDPSPGGHKWLLSKDAGELNIGLEKAGLLIIEPGVKTPPTSCGTVLAPFLPTRKPLQNGFWRQRTDQLQYGVGSSRSWAFPTLCQLLFGIAGLCSFMALNYDAQKLTW